MEAAAAAATEVQAERAVPAIALLPEKAAVIPTQDAHAAATGAMGEKAEKEVAAVTEALPETEVSKAMVAVRDIIAPPF